MLSMNFLFPAETKDGDSRRMARDIDRDRRRTGNERFAINRELAQLDTSAKALAKAGRTDELMIVAGQIASLRRQRTELTRVDSQQQRIKNTIQANARRDRNMESLQRGTAHLEASNASCPPATARKIAAAYQKAIAKSAHNSELMEDALDEEDDGDAELENGQSIADEYMAAAGIQLANTMPALPKQTAAAAASQREPAARAAYAAQETASPLSSSVKAPPPPPEQAPTGPDEAPVSSGDDISALEERLRNIKRTP